MITCPKCGVSYQGAEKFCPKDGTRLTGTGENALRMPSIPPDKDPLINKVIQNRYKVLEQIGEGGMGVVYVAEHVEIEKKVALKVLRDDFSKRQEVVTRFRQEARSASKIGNAHIVDVTDFGQIDNGGVYFVMEYLQGKGLSDIIKEEEISDTRIINIVKQIARALDAAHKLGIVHRDLKPENIFLIEDEEKKDFVKILDFGIAKISDRDSEGQRLTKTGMIFGTPEYMSPEQASGKATDHRVDIYALGCIMFEMLTGRVPFEGENFMGILTQHMFEEIPVIEEVGSGKDVPEYLKRVVYKAMAKDRRERFEEMTQLLEALEGGEKGEIPDYENEATIRTVDLKRDEGKPSAIEEKGRSATSTLTIVLLIIVIGALGGMGYGYHKGYILKDPDLEKNHADEITKEDMARIEEEKQSQKEKEVVVIEEETEEEKVQETEEEQKIEPIEVTVNTEPEGAVIIVSGMGQVCSSSPCSVKLEEGIPIEIEAKKDGVSQNIKFTPSKENKELNLVLAKEEEAKDKKKKKRKSGSRKRTDKKKKDGKSSLKIPDMFKKN